VIPRTLVQNSGGNAMRVLTELRVRTLSFQWFISFFLQSFYQAKHANGENSWGVNGDTGKVVDMKSYGLYESASVKVTK
jgi:T-complex protein 1 subunit gamma